MLKPHYPEALSEMDTEMRSVHAGVGAEALLGCRGCRGRDIVGVGLDAEPVVCVGVSVAVDDAGTWASEEKSSAPLTVAGEAPAGGGRSPIRTTRRKAVIQ